MWKKQFHLQYLIVCCLLLFIFSSCQISRQVNRAIKSKDKEVQYNLAEQLYVKAHYNSAQKLYENILPYYRNDAKYNDIVYKYGMCSYWQEDYNFSIEVFNNMLQSIANFSQKEEVHFLVVKSHYNLAEPYFLEQTNTYTAIDQAQQFISLFPKSYYVDSCLSIIKQCRSVLEKKSFTNANLYYRMGYYKASLIQFQSLILNFPESIQGDFYEYLKIKSAAEVLVATVSTKKEQRQLELIDFCTNFAELYPDSKYFAEIQTIQTNTN